MLYSNNGQVLLHLSLIKGIGPRSVLSLISMLEGISIDSGAARGSLGESINLKKWYDLSIIDLIKKGCSASIAQKVVEGLANRDLLDAEVELLHEHSIQWISFLDQEYSSLLQAISAPPIGLYNKGIQQKKSTLQLGIVGSRLAGSYAEHALHQVVTPFVLSGGEIISGGALGVDGMAHALAVKHQAPTTVVLGSGLLSLYPKQNLYLFDEVIASGGTLCSSFSLEIGPDRGNFPMRNRIIAGLSQAVLVVQAAEKSGALITAEYALKEGRPVCAIPGSIDDPLSAGCHSLLRQGAALIASYDDLCAELGYEVLSMNEQEKNLSLFSQKPLESKPVFKQIKTDIFEPNPLLKLLENPCHVESLMKALGQSLDEVEDQLFNLQLEGVIIQRVDGSWILATQ